MEMEPLRDVRVYGSPECEHRSHASSFDEDIFHFSWSMKLFDSDSWMKSMVYFGDLLFCYFRMPSWKSKLSWIASMPSLDTWNIFWSQGWRTCRTLRVDAAQDTANAWISAIGMLWPLLVTGNVLSLDSEISLRRYKHLPQNDALKCHMQGAQAAVAGNPSHLKNCWKYGCFQKIGVPQNGWFTIETPIKMDDLGGKPTIFGNAHMKASMTDSSDEPRNLRCPSWSWSPKVGG